MRNDKRGYKEVWARIPYWDDEYLFLIDVNTATSMRVRAKFSKSVGHKCAEFEYDLDTLRNMTLGQDGAWLPVKIKI